MKRRIFIFTILAIFVITGNALALDQADLGIEITIADGIADSSASSALGIAGEDDETEKGTTATQAWDLEGMFWNNITSSLFIIGGFDYENGVTVDSRNHNYSIGDIFIGSNYVLDLERKDDDGNLKADGHLDIIRDYSDTAVCTDISASNPYQYASGGVDIGDGKYKVHGSANTSLFGFSDWGSGLGHYVLEVYGFDTLDIKNVINAGNLIHLTLECGNDTIHGEVPVPEPSSMILFCLGLLGMVAIIGRNKVLLKSSN